MALDWPRPNASAIVLIDPNRWTKGQFGTFWANTTLLMALDIDSYIEGESEFDEASQTFFLTREAYPPGR